MCVPGNTDQAQRQSGHQGSERDPEVNKTAVLLIVAGRGVEVRDAVIWESTEFMAFLISDRLKIEERRSQAAR